MREKEETDLTEEEMNNRDLGESLRRNRTPGPIEWSEREVEEGLKDIEMKGVDE